MTLPSAHGVEHEVLRDDVKMNSDHKSFRASAPSVGAVG